MQPALTDIPAHFSRLFSCRYVVLDYQPMGLEQQPYDLEVFVEMWANLWKQVSTPRFLSLILECSVLT